MKVILRTMQGVLLCFALGVPAVAQDREEAARQFLVEAIRAYRAAQTTEDLVERADLLRNASDALEAIERDYVTTDTGIVILTGQSIGNFDPSRVAVEYEAVAGEAHLASCKATYSAECSYELRNRFFSELNGMTMEQVLAEYGAIDRLAYLMTVGGDWRSVASDMIPVMTEDEVWNLYDVIYAYGFGPELLEIHAMLPPEHPVRRYAPDSAALLEGGFFHDQELHIYFGSRFYASLERLVAAGQTDINGAIFAMGSKDLIRPLLEAEGDPTAAFATLFDAYAFPSGAEKAQSALIELGHSAFVVDHIRDHINEISGRTQVPWLEIDPNELTRAVREILPEMGYQILRHRLLWAAIAKAPVDEVGGLLADVLNQGLITEPDVDERHSPVPFAMEAGIAAGRAGGVERARILEAHGSDLPHTEAMAAFLDGLAAGLLVAEEPSGDLIQSRLNTENTGDRLDTGAAAIAVLVKEGRLEDAVNGLEAVFGVKIPQELAGKAATLPALVGNLEPFIRAHGNGFITQDDYDATLTGYRDFLLAAEEHGYDVTGAPAQIRSLLSLYAGDGGALSDISMAIIEDPDPDRPLRGRLLYEAGVGMDGSARSYAVDAAQYATLGPSE